MVKRCPGLKDFFVCIVTYLPPFYLSILISVIQLNSIREIVKIDFYCRFSKEIEKQSSNDIETEKHLFSAILSYNTVKSKQNQWPLIRCTCSSTLCDSVSCTCAQHHFNCV